MNPKISIFLERLVVALSGAVLISAAEAAEYWLTADEIKWKPRPVTDPDFELEGWAYNGQIPGPEIRVKEGELVTIHFTNKLEVPTGIHWHGVEVPAGMDGVPGISQDPVKPGESFDYKFIARPAGTRFYHTHGSGGAIPDEAMQMQMGLYGAFIVEGKNERRADREYTVILSDRNEKLDPMMTDTNPDSDLMEPNLFFLNGKTWPDTDHLMVKKGERVRLRLINASSMSIHPMHLHGHTMKVGAIDGNRLPMPFSRDTVPLAPGERYDLEFVAKNPGLWPFHCHELHHADAGMGTLFRYEGF